VEYDTVQYFRMEYGTIHWGLHYGTEDFVIVLESAGKFDF